jgi:hypothetical protein
VLIDSVNFLFILLRALWIQQKGQNKTIDDKTTGGRKDCRHVPLSRYQN